MKSWALLSGRDRGFCVQWCPQIASSCWACERGVASSTLVASALLSPRMTQVCVLSVWCFIRLQTCRLQHREKPALTPLQFAVRFGIMQPLFWM